MKKVISFAVVLTILSTGCFAQKSVQTPSVVTSSFAKDFPGSTTKWEKEGSNYEANFKLKGKSMSALYDAKGNRQETEESIKVTELPQSIKDYISQHYKGEKIKEAAIITKANGEIIYEAEVKDMDVLFSKEGKFIKTERD